MMDDEDAKKFWKQIEYLESQQKKPWHMMPSSQGRVVRRNDGVKSTKLVMNGKEGSGHIINELTFKYWRPYDKVRDGLEQLQKDLYTFKRIKIPEFSVEYDKPNWKITLKKQFIRGDVITDDRKWADIIWHELVERKGEYTFHSWDYHNFRVDKQGDLYYVDLDDYKKVPHEQRVTEYSRKFTR